MNKTEVNNDTVWLDEPDYRKAVAQLRMQVQGVFDFMRVGDKLPVKYMYGMTEYVFPAIDEIVRLAEDFGLRVRKVDKPIDLQRVRRNRR